MMFISMFNYLFSYPYRYFRTVELTEQKPNRHSNCIVGTQRLYRFLSLNLAIKPYFTIKQSYSSYLKKLRVCHTPMPLGCLRIINILYKYIQDTTLYTTRLHDIR